MEKKIQPEEIPGTPSPVKIPDIKTPVDPEEPCIPEEDPDMIPDEDPYITPPEEVPSPAEGP